jgi:glycosyltransferase involved in cell wall biosynthesis
MAALHQISVNDGDIKQLREVVIALLKTPQQRTENIQAGQKYIQHELTPARHAERCVEVYRKVIQRFQEKKRGIA